jgi:D-3-phosphoglycerate dehydrogenase
MLNKKMKVLIAGDYYMRPSLIKKVITEYLGIELSKKLIFKTVEFEYPEEEIVLLPDTIIPSGMSFSHYNFAEKKQKNRTETIDEYYGFLDDLKNYIINSHILIVHGAAVPKRILQMAKELKLICVLRGGPKNIDIITAKELGIKIVNTPGKTARAVAESVLGGLLSLTRNIVSGSYTLQKEGVWKPSFYKYNLCGIELKDHILGLIGFGHIAKELVGLLKGFKMKKILAFDPYKNKREIEKSGVESVELKQLLKESNIISLHARLTSTSRNILGKRELRMMMNKPIIINMARGALMDYEALTEALKDKRISGAILDVYGDAPFKEYRDLLSMPNVICTPHLAGGSKETVMRASKMVAEEIRRFMLGLTLKNEIK